MKRKFSIFFAFNYFHYLFKNHPPIILLFIFLTLNIFLSFLLPCTNNLLKNQYTQIIKFFKLLTSI